MPLPTGSKLGSYEIVAPLGAGGMGEVFRARDARLGRDVALKVLPDLFAGDPDRLARFKREAQLLAALNHPNIAAIYGLERVTDGQAALVLELVEGPTLADRIAEGPIPLDEAVRIGRQIGSALEAAHEQGIIHRDLKPANIKVRPDGTVKVLDFGLAKALDPVASAPGQPAAATITSPALTRMGVILGTAAYMSPEQAKGRAADKRSDIWAFGCVLFEMLTGRRPFEGQEISDTLASVLKSDPEWHAMPATRAAVRARARRGLPQEGSQRPHRRHLDGALRPRSAALDIVVTARRRQSIACARHVGTRAPRARRRRHWRRPRSPPPPGGLPPPPAPSTRFALTLPPGQQLTVPRQAIAISPDGTRIAYAADNRLYLRPLSIARGDRDRRHRGRAQPDVLA